MFEVPEAKRIKRSELYQTDSDDGDSVKAEQSTGLKGADAIPDYGFDYDFVTANKNTIAPPTAQPDEPENYEFRLFAAPSLHKPNDNDNKHSLPRPTLIALPRTPSPALEPPEGRLLRSRPLSHYLTDSTTHPRTQYTSTAITTTSLHTLASTPWPGTCLPWRVTHLKRSLLPNYTNTSTTTITTPHSRLREGRSKPNKKRRIHLRRLLASQLLHRSSSSKNNKSGTTNTIGAKVAGTTKRKAKPIKVLNSETGREEFELTPEEREKRTARNREKKVKRRQREREKKAAAALRGEETGGDQEGARGDDEGSGS